MEVHGLTVIESDGRRVVWSGDGPRVCPVIRLLVYRLSGGATSDGGEVDVGGTTDTADCGSPQDVGTLLSQWHAGSWPDRADGEFHVRHGGQRHRLQYCLDLRHLSVVHQA